MKRMHGVIATCLAAAVSIANATEVEPQEPIAARVPALAPAAPDDVVMDEIIVVFDRGTSSALVQLNDAQDLLQDRVIETGDTELDDLARAASVRSIRPLFPGAIERAELRDGRPDLSGYFVVSFDPALNTPEGMVAAYLAAPGVIHAEAIGIHPLLATPNDGNYASQWHLNQSTDRDIDAPEAWNIETGDPSVAVAVLDSGVRYYHKDLGGSAASATNPTATDGNIWINTAEKNGTAGVDDDGNGFVDDWVGWDFVTGLTGCWSGEDCSTADNDPRDFNGHGTHCAGNVAAINNNGYATCSPAGGWGNGTLQPAANGVKVMSLRIGWSQSYLGQEAGFVRMDFAASAFYYAANNGASVASCSWGSSNSGGIAAAVDYFIASGGLVFKAAGNSNNQTADYLCGRPDVYCVASTSQTDAKSSFSSYGTWVDISAPGTSIVSSYHNHNDPTPDYVATLSGTSMATPLVASAAALVWSQNPGWSAAQVWARVRDTADDIDALNPSYVGLLGSGRINLFNAVNQPAGCQNNSECDDGDPCNGAEVCFGGQCQAGAITDCNGNGISDACDIAGGASEDCNANGTPDECEGGDPCGVYPTLLINFVGSTSVPGVGTVEDDDIVAYNTGTGAYSLYFDGSDVGLSSLAIDALAVLPGGDLLISITTDSTLAGLTGGPSGTSVDDSDIVRFTPTSLGATTAGSWTFYFDGSDAGLTTSSEDIDALAIAADGKLLISTTASPGVTGLSSLQDEDIIAFTATSLGSVTSGTWSYYFDGGDVGLSNSSSENVDAAAVDGAGRILLSTTGNFSVTGASGADEDAFRFTPTSLGTNTAGSYQLYLDGSAAGIPTSSDINALHLIE